MPTSDLILGALRRDSDAAVTDGTTHSLYTNTSGRLKVSTTPAAYDVFTGSITTATTVVGPLDVARASNVLVSVSGTFTGVNFLLEGSSDGTNWSVLEFVRTNGAGLILQATGVIASPGANTAFAYEASVNGIVSFRVRATAWATGTAAIRIDRAALATEPIVAVGTHAVSQSGTWNVGTVTTLTTLSGTTTLTPGTGATNLGKAEDAVHASGDVGVMALGVRNDNAATDLTSATADYSPLAVDAKGAGFVRDRSTAATKTTVASSATSVTILAANAARRSASIRNSSTAILYIDETGATATSAAATVELAPGGYYELPLPSSVSAVTGIWAAANGQAVVVERV